MELQPITVKVKTTHIKNGKREHVCQCPIALATQEALRNAGLGSYRTLVDGDVQVHNSHKTPKFACTETQLWKFIHAFDNGEKVKPFTFKLQPVKKNELNDYDDYEDDDF
jgi:hypothetical protein